MTKISNDLAYLQDEIISDLDFIIGTNGDLTSRPTKTFLLGKIRAYVISGLSPLLGGTMRISELVYTGVITTPQEVLNAIAPAITIRPYEILIVNVNGNKYLLKMQDALIGEDETQTVASDFINIQGAKGDSGDAGAQGIQGIQGIQGAQGPQGPQGVQGNAGVNGTDGADGNNGSQGIQGIQGIQGVQGPVGPAGADGIDGVDGTNGINGVDASNNLQRDATTSFSVSDSDNNYVIQIKNSTTPITVTIPSTGLRDKFNVGFKLKGSADVTFVGASGVTIINPIGFKGKGLGYCAYIERDGNSQSYDLLGDTKV